MSEVKVNRAYVQVRMSKDTYEAYSEEMYEKKVSFNNAKAKNKAKYSKRHNLNFEGTKEDRAPQPVTIIKGGVQIVVPSRCLTKTGKIKKSGLAYINKMLEARV